ncbi:MAG: thrombospondin, partial [Myxococcales bacterium]
MPPRRALSLALLAPLLLIAGNAQGADCQPASRVSTCIDADNLWHRPGSAQFLAVAGTAAAASGQMTFGLMAAYQRRPIVFRLPSSEPGGSDAYAIDDQVNASLLWSYGLGRGIELTAAAPVTLYQTGVGTSPLTSQDSLPIVRSALRDVRLGFNASLLARPGGTVGAGPAVSVRGELILPSGDETLFAGGRGVGFAPSAVADYRVGPVVVGAEFGLRQRRPVEIAGSTVGTMLYESLGVSVDVLGERLSFAAEAFALQG